MDNVNIPEDMDTVHIFDETAPVHTTQSKSDGPRAYHHGDLRRSLIEAALALVTEEQDWTFSLREVARRAGVSHNAPYNHFADKRELLAAVAVAGFDTLGERLLAGTSGLEAADAALVKGGVIYVTFGVENPAHYRLMFSSALATARAGRPEPVAAAGARTRSILAGIIRRGAVAGVFDAAFAEEQALEVAVLSAWSTVHGLTMLMIDRIAESPQLGLDGLTQRIAGTLCCGLAGRRGP